LASSISFTFQLSTKSQKRAMTIIFLDHDIFTDSELRVRLRLRSHSRLHSCL
jgi:hypothetical protein